MRPTHKISSTEILGYDKGYIDFFEEFSLKINVLTIESWR